VAMVWDSLPDRGEVKRLGEVCESKERRNPTKTPNLSFKYVDISSVDNSLFKIVDHKDYLGRDAPSRARKVIRTNDVIFATTRPYLQSIAMVSAEYDDQICSTGFCVLRATEVVEPKWIFHCVRSRRFMDQILPLMRGSSYPAVTDRDVLSATIPLPTLDEQRRIVARIEELTERIDAARRLRAEAAEEAAAILPSALAEVFEEGEERGEQITKLGQVIREMRNGIYKPKQFYGDGYPSLRMYNIQDRQIVMEDVKYLKVTEDELETYGLKPGDILVNRVNSKELVGKAALVPDGLGPCTFESKNIRVRVDETQVAPAHVVYFLDSVVCKQQIAQRLKPAIGQATINQGDIQSLEMPLPPLDEQRRIVEHLDAVQAKVEAIRRYQEETREEIEAMTGAVLEGAFRGEL